jgi:hypothetical protein
LSDENGLGKQFEAEIWAEIGSESQLQIAYLDYKFGLGAAATHPGVSYDDRTTLTQLVDRFEAGRQGAPSFQSCHQQSVVVPLVGLTRCPNLDAVVPLGKCSRYWLTAFRCDSTPIYRLNPNCQNRRSKPPAAGQSSHAGTLCPRRMGRPSIASFHATSP